MSTYNTHQRQVLLQYLYIHHDTKFTARELYCALKDENISQSAVYRNLAILERDGRVLRSTSSGSRELYYTFVDAECCKNRLHLSCKRCGHTYHLSGESAEQLIKITSEQLGFDIDHTETVLYGICQKCKD